MRIEAVEEPGVEWDAFAESRPEAALGHAAAWAGILRESYGLAPLFLAARDPGGALAGVLPLARFRSLRGHRELVSLPYLDTAGILAQSCVAETALLEAALRLAREERAQAVELRHPVRPTSVTPPRPSLDRVDLVMPLAADEEAQWRSLPAKVRNQTRKAQREGLEIARGAPHELLKSFYGAFCCNMRDLGSPVHAERFFGSMARRFGDRLRFIVAMLGERPVGGLVAIRFAGKITVPWASSLRAERRRCPNNLIYWEALRWGIAQGATEFDFGRSPRGSGTYRFKHGWGAEERALAWTRVGADGSPLPVRRSADSAVLKQLSRAWARLPLAVTNRVGPRVRGFLSE
jgi:FemAB-related protein (PEP-CTERM system-associated)